MFFSRYLFFLTPPHFNSTEFLLKCDLRCFLSVLSKLAFPILSISLLCLFSNYLGSYTHIHVIYYLYSLLEYAVHKEHRLHRSQCRNHSLWSRVVQTCLDRGHFSFLYMSYQSEHYSASLVLSKYLLVNNHSRKYIIAVSLYKERIVFDQSFFFFFFWWWELVM